MLSKRLKTIAFLIPKKVTVVDVGCDHALLDIYLTLNNENKCIASDINSNALKSAQKNISKYNLQDKISLVQSNGLENICIKKDFYVVISGMGTSNIINILSKKNDVQNLIISSHTEYEKLRKELNKMNYVITDEIIIKDKKIYYLIIKFKKGKHKYSKKDYYLGPILKTKKDENIIEYYNHLLTTNLKNIENIPRKYFKKRFKLKQENKWLKKIL